MSMPANSLTADEQRARVLALGAITRAKARSFDAARTWFVEALRLDPRLDLATIPHFWHLPRGGQEAAVEAYELSGRDHQAAVLAAMIRRTFRPRLVRA